MTDIPAGATVSVRNALSGKFMCKVYLTGKNLQGACNFHPEKQRLQRAQFCVCDTISSQIKVPWHCVRIVSWELMEDTSEHDYDASFLWVPTHQRFRSECVEDNFCWVCRSRLTFEDEMSCRHMNCLRCFPCSLCSECRIYLPKDTFDENFRKQVAFPWISRYLQENDFWPVCLRCLEESDLPAIASQEPPDRVWHRMGLLSDVFMWKRPDPSRAIWWDVTYHSAQSLSYIPYTVKKQMFATYMRAIRRA